MQNVIQCKHGNLRRNFIHVEHLCEEHATNTLDIISTPKISTHLFCFVFLFIFLFLKLYNRPNMIEFFIHLQNYNFSDISLQAQQGLQFFSVAKQILF